MITDMIPLLVFTAFVVIARNVFEAYIQHREQQRIEALEPARIEQPHRQRAHRTISR